MALMLDKLERLKARLAVIGRNGVNTRFLELKNMVTVAQLVTKAAYIRTESRGTHYRQDSLATDNKNWLKHICFEQTNDTIHTNFC
jgi:succinate dehydrogenase / fumarate reductase flavoprotein subunit/fumarate reductase flavoprotein subunit